MHELALCILQLRARSVDLGVRPEEPAQRERRAALEARRREAEPGLLWPVYCASNLSVAAVDSYAGTRPIRRGGSSFFMQYTNPYLHFPPFQSFATHLKSVLLSTEGACLKKLEGYNLKRAGPISDP